MVMMLIIMRQSGEDRCNMAYNFDVRSPHRLVALAVVLAIIAGAAVNLVSLHGVPITGNAAGFVYVNVSCTTSITLVNNTLTFGSMATGTTNDTTDTFPPPFYVRNDGNVEVNISIRATSLFSASNPNPTSFFTFRCGNVSTEFNCTCPAGYNTSQCTTFDQLNGSQLQWARITLNSTTAALAARNLSYIDTNDEVEIEINVSIPGNESAGGKSSVVSIEAVGNTEAGACV